MTIEVDRKIYSDSCISKCIYALSKEYGCCRTLNGEKETIEVFSRNPSTNEEEIRHVFLQTLNDYHLRDIIHHETDNIRTLLYAKAFAESDDNTEES